MQFVMTEHVTKDDVVKALGGHATAPPEWSTKIRLGVEDLVPVLILFLLLFGYWRNELSFKELLGYLGLTGTGGVWGLISGKVKGV